LGALRRCDSGTDGNFYGTTPGTAAGGVGEVFQITQTGTLTVLHIFCLQSDCADGAGPIAGLLQAIDGNLYGTTYGGGVNGYGTVFKITPRGKLTTLHSFDGTDGDRPEAELVQGTDGNFYGTTFLGGAYGSYGTVFKITPRGKLTTLHSFNGTDGDQPAGLVLAIDGNFYGTTEDGGPRGRGTIFEITPSGTLTTLHTFDITDGEYIVAALIQGTNGTLYGTSSGGGPHSHGTVFSLSVGLGPFVETEPISGAVGATVNVLGTNLTGTTEVTFHGIAATFTVVSSSLITATVPTGATTGIVKVQTPNGTLSSNVLFQVLP